MATKKKQATKKKTTSKPKVTTPDPVIIPVLPPPPDNDVRLTYYVRVEGGGMDIVNTQVQTVPFVDGILDGKLREAPLALENLFDLVVRDPVIFRVQSRIRELLDAKAKKQGAIEDERDMEEGTEMIDEDTGEVMKEPLEPEHE